MPVNVASPPIHRIADAYQVTRQQLHQLRRHHNLTPGDLLDPDAVFACLLKTGRGSRLRTRLSYPAGRAEIRKQLTI